MASVFTEEGYAEYASVVAKMSYDDLRIARRRALKCEAYRYRKYMANLPTEPHREKQIQVEIIEAEMRRR
jgi:hypothetical protein